MPELSSSNDLIKRAKSGLRNFDAAKLADAIEALAEVEPLRWPQLLLLDGVLPEPSPKIATATTARLPQTLSCLMKATDILLERGVDHVDTVERIILALEGFLTLQAYYRDIIEELSKLAFVKSRPEVQIHRLLAFVEAQSRTVEGKFREISDAAGVVDLRTGRASAFRAKYDDSKASLGEVFDGVCETVELGLRYILHANPSLSQPAFQPDLSPYKDPDFEKFLVLAGIWRAVSETWANIRFSNWRWTLDGEGHHVCAPTDQLEYLREHAGATRYELFIAERLLLRLAHERGAAAYSDCLGRVSGSIKVPAGGEPWDGHLDLAEMKRLCGLSPFRAGVEQGVNARHYMPLVEKATVGSVGWREWVAGKGALYCLADAMSQAATDQVPEDDVACMRYAIVVREDAIARFLTDCGGLTESQSRKLLDVLRFDPRRKSLEIWDQPLIPCGQGIVFLVPALMRTGNPARALENFVTHWGGVSFDVRGGPFEKYVLAEVVGRCSPNAEQGIVVPGPDSQGLEFDIVVWWEGYVLLIEAKCEKAVFSAADYFRAKKQLEKSIDQLIVRRRSLPRVWSVLREKAPALGLPEVFVGEDRVLCISITNIMDFTGYSRDGVVVTDDSCFFRFFENRMIEKFIVGESDFKVEDFEAIRLEEIPHPAELMPYLLDPPQMRRLVAKMQVKRHVVPAIPPRSPGFITTHVEFTPDLVCSTDSTEWVPFLLSDNAYAIASFLCQKKQVLDMGSLEHEPDLKEAAEELIRKKIIGPGTANPGILGVVLKSPMCVRLPDGRCVVGENAFGQMLRWLGRQYPDTAMVLSPQLAASTSKGPQ